jgi:hypothetical protein
MGELYRNGRVKAGGKAMKWTLLVAFVLCGIAGPMSVANAKESTISEDFSARQRIRPIATRLEVYPSSRQVRRCIDWYAIERRPSGEVLTPHMRCWWTKR